MKETLGIFVSSDEHLSDIINLTKAASAKGKKVIIFFTNFGVRLTQDPRFKELEGLAEMTLCNVNFEAFGLPKKPIPGIDEKGYASQARHGMLIEDCDRYVVF
ncbi:MAG: peroxiredoxin [Deltaproteobacteria bacterium]|nr:peroxiredoxin [Deltaproteobacteria bacterium]